MGSGDSGREAAMRKQQDELDKMQEEEKRKNKLVQAKTLKGIRTAAGGGGGFSSGDRDTLG